MTKFALFRAEDGLLVPQDIARSMWKDDQMHGVATCGALGRELENAVIAAGRDDLRPARLTVDLFRAPSMGPCQLASTLVREGSRLMLVDATLTQDGQVKARASALFLQESENPGGQVWQTTDVPQPPPAQIAPISEEPRVPIFHSETAGWSQHFADHQNASRKQVWQTALAIVVGEKPTPFQGLAGAVDTTSMVCNWGDRGVEYINTDITLAISRPPVSLEIGLAALNRSAHDGVTVGSAVVFDRDGVIGTSTVTALANARRTVDFTRHDFSAGAPGA